MQTEIVKRLSEQFDAAQRTLHELRLTAGCDAFPEFELKPELRHQAALQAAMRALAHRRLRDSHFEERDIFGEPAWDILLDLYVHHEKRVDVSVTSACIASAVPATTGLRWLNLLKDQGLLFIEPDPNDNRRRFVRLTPEGYECMTQYLNQVASK